ncbi:MAG: sensor histidine kinase [Bacteroidaceae bacterium]|nr:sensor histidine kinase [Bacteroidaceae bacterium]
MKNKILIFFLTLFSFWGISVLFANPTGVHKNCSHKVLIINSYSEDLEWNASIVKELENSLTEEHPGVSLNIGYLNCDLLQRKWQLVQLRNLLWSCWHIIPSQMDLSDLSVKSCFLKTNRPDAIIFIGVEGFETYRSILIHAQSWKDVPIVICAANDSINQLKTRFINNKYSTETHRIKIDSCRNTDILYHKNAPVFSRRLIDKKDILHENDTSILFRSPLSVTGVIWPTNVEQNLELILKAKPDLKEILWIDGFYETAQYNLHALQRLLRKKYPNIKLQTILATPFNSDAIYSELSKDKPHRALLTFGWSTSNLISNDPDKDLQFLLSESKQIPLFSLTRRDFNADKWVGGFYFSTEECIHKTVHLINRIFSGEQASRMSFQRIEASRIIINQTAAEHYNLNTSELQNSTHVNIPKSFYEAHSLFVLLLAIAATLLIGWTIYWIRQHQYNIRIKSQGERIELLYNKLHTIYRHLGVNIGVYSENGDCVFIIVKGDKERPSSTKKSRLNKNLFDFSFLTPALRADLLKGKELNMLISLENGKPTKLFTPKSEELFQIIIRTLPPDTYENSAYMLLSFNLTPMLKSKKEKEHIERLLNLSSISLQWGIAYYDPIKASGFATPAWYETLQEPSGKEGWLLPTFQSVVREDRDLLVKFQGSPMQPGEATRELIKDIRVNAPNGSDCWTRLYLYYLRPNLIIGLAANINELKKDQTELANLKEKIDEGSLAAHDFIANISHEVRTPLNVILGYSSLLSSTELEVDERTEFSKIVLKNTEHLEFLVRDICEYALLNSQKSSFEKTYVPAREIQKREQAFWAPRLEGSSITFSDEEFDVEGEILINLYYFELLMQHLISNAFKFTTQGQVSIGRRRRRNYDLFYVRDTGCGIAKENQERIFKHFEKLDQFTPGTGLGLSICKSIVAHHGGKIGIISQLGKGTTIWLVIPQKE